ncbi:MAG TPA: biopolymer transporter ExbD [Polyangiaceae bacterium]|nr:biopolymer transporter ExbD [Polyangiaceae bacterium]
MNPPAEQRRARLRVMRAVIRTDRAGFERPEVKADINVTPLVDVVLVLLIIFMVVTPMIASGVAVDLPRTAHHSRKPDDGKDIIVSVARDGRVYVGTQALNRVEELGRVIVAERRKAPNKAVFLKGDLRAHYGSVRRAMQSLHDANIQDIVLGTEELTTVH